MKCNECFHILSIIAIVIVLVTCHRWAFHQSSIIRFKKCVILVCFLLVLCCSFVLCSYCVSLHAHFMFPQALIAHVTCSTLCALYTTNLNHSYCYLALKFPILAPYSYSSPSVTSLWSVCVCFPAQQMVSIINSGVMVMFSLGGKKVLGSARAISLQVESQ